MLKFGTISNIDFEKGLARVKFEEDGIVSGWLHISVRKTLKDKEFFPYDINEHVWCLMDGNVEEGVIGGAIYSEKSLPLNAEESIFAIRFENKDAFVYDKLNRTFTAKISDALYEMGSDGITVKNGTETLKSIVSDLLDAILAETHSTAMGPTGTPLNFATYQAIKLRLDSLFKE